MKTTRQSITLPKIDSAAVRDAADKEDVTFSEMIRRIVMDWRKQMGLKK